MKFVNNHELFPERTVRFAWRNNYDHQCVDLNIEDKVLIGQLQHAMQWYHVMQSRHLPQWSATNPPGNSVTGQ